MAVVQRPMERLKIHRMEVLEHKLTKVPINKEAGIIYSYSVVQRDEKNAWIRGWNTGPSYGDDGSDWQLTPIGMAYAPQGFFVGNLAFIKSNDRLMGIGPEECTSVQSFLEDIEKAYGVGKIIDKFQGFTIVGEILPYSRMIKGEYVFNNFYKSPPEVI